MNKIKEEPLLYVKFGGKAFYAYSIMPTTEGFILDTYANGNVVVPKDAKMTITWETTKID